MKNSLPPDCSGSTASTVGSTATPTDPDRTNSADLPKKLLSSSPHPRFRFRRKQKPHTKVTTAVTTSVAALSAAGVPRRKVAKALDLSPTTVQAVLAKPETQAMVSEIRDNIKRVALEGAQAVSREAWAWVNKVASAKNDPRAFDSLMRALLAMEKLSSSASGEARRIEGSVSLAPGELTEELKELVNALRK